jgi:O-antigen ligase
VQPTRSIDGSGFVMAGLALAPFLAGLEVLILYRFGVPAGAIAFPALTLLALIFWKPVIGIYAALLAVPLETLSLKFGPGGLSPTEGLFLLTAGAVALRMAIGYRSRQAHPVLISLFALMGVIALGFFYAIDTVVIFKITLVWTSFVVVAVHVATLGRKDIERALFALSIAGGIVGIVALAGAGQQQAIAGGAVVTGRAQAGFQHPNVLAFFLVLTLPGALVLAASGPTWRRPIAGAAAGLALAGLVLTLTRGAIIGAALSLIVLLWWPPFRRFAGILLVGLALFAVFNAKALSRSQEFAIVSERLQTISKFSTTSGSRVEIYKTVPKIVANHPFLGVGMGNFSVVSPHYGLRDIQGAAFDHAHNVILTMAVELGLIGLAVFLLVTYFVARTAVRAVRDRGSPDFPFALASASALMGIVGSSISDVPYRTNAITGVMMLHIGALVAFERRADARRAPREARRGLADT